MACQSDSKGDCNMQQEVETLQQQFASLQKAHRASRLQIFTVIVAIIGMFTVFTYATYMKVSANFNDAAVQRAVANRADVVLPLAATHLLRAGSAALPEYQALASARMQEVGPQLAGETRDRFERLPHELSSEMNARLQSSFDAVASRLDGDIAATFPNLPAEKKTQMIAKFHEDLKTEISARLEAIAARELVQMHGLMEKFDLPAGDQPQDVAQLEKHFLRTLIQLADHHVETSDATADLVNTDN